MIQINMTRAKEIAHVKRRNKRDELFAPHDEVIMKQIPGVDATEAEAARATIRDQDAVVQQAIEEASDADTLKTALEEYGAL